MHRRPVLAAVIAASAALCAGCAGGAASGAQPGASSASSTSAAAAPSASPAPPGSTAAPTAPTAAADGTAAPPAPVGPDCDAYTGSGDPSAPGPLERAAQEPVLDVMARDPRLSGFTTALTGGVHPQVDLTQELQEGRFTVFAPVQGSVFSSPEWLEEVRDDPEALRFHLDYHLVPGQQLAPEELVGAALPTLQGWDLPVFGTPEELRVSEDSVGVVCGIATANARLYLVETSVHPAGDYTVPRG
ncbi:fasciclin domain-containing protein [Quadrisphaera sp. DSM 44207]|uniref:fasciclin domain-containing protein n=1 Tax=Quadrisphaera sp. DSM 44207 TaxID=1881057 RepID=UPI00087EBB23|nr:fasciclin domain-containing protein [Quadrisphaera sp. DSM 44207]SDQ70203.1 Uncaracterized surface protein containing fasciclin (FAS1) repeats [Quadrisphaera sp. DSM 44207]